MKARIVVHNSINNIGIIVRVKIRYPYNDIVLLLDSFWLVIGEWWGNLDESFFNSTVHDLHFFEGEKELFDKINEIFLNNN